MIDGFFFEKSRGESNKIVANRLTITYRIVTAKLTFFFTIFYCNIFLYLLHWFLELPLLVCYNKQKQYMISIRENRQGSPENSAAQTIISNTADKYRQFMEQKQFPNPLRGMEQCFKEITNLFEKNNLPSELLPVSMTIGDLSPISFDDEPEEKYIGLADRLVLDPEGYNFALKQQLERKILIDYKKHGDYLTRYDVSARGTEESRNLIGKEFGEIGIPITTNEVWMADGGMAALIRIIRTFNNHQIKENGMNGRLLAPTPSFIMATNVALDNGLKVEFVPTSHFPDQELSPEAIDEFYKTPNRLGIDAVLITPANNPTASSYKPENLKRTIERINQYNSRAIFIFDMAYISLIPNERARAIVQTIVDSQILGQSFFAFSESKILARPRQRVGAVVIFNKIFQEMFQQDTIRNYPSFSGTVDVEFQALKKIITPQTTKLYLDLLRQRQQTLLETLRILDPEKKYFTNLDQISIPGYPALSENSREQDVPLYLWVKMQPGVDAFEIIKKFGMIGSPGTCFGCEDCHLRFSLGVVSTKDILNKLPKKP